MFHQLWCSTGTLEVGFVENVFFETSLVVLKIIYNPLVKYAQGFFVFSLIIVVMIGEFGAVD